MTERNKLEKRKWHKRNGMICMFLALSIGIGGAILFDKDTIESFLTANLAILFWLCGSFMLFVRP